MITVADARNQLINGLANGATQVVIDKASLSNAAAGQILSLWRATGQPGQGAIPTAAALLNNASAGALPFSNQTAPVTSYLGLMSLLSANNAQSIEIHDRIANQAGLSLALTTSQTTNLPIDLLTLAPPAARLGAADYSSGQWYLEIYADGGATASNATINVTYNNGTTGNLNTLAVGGTLRIGRCIPLTPLIPTAQQGLFIRGINSVILSASTTVAGNFGFTYRRQIGSSMPLPLGNKFETFDWADLGCPEIPNSSCLELVMTTSTTTTGVLRGTGKIAHI